MHSDSLIHKKGAKSYQDTKVSLLAWLTQGMSRRAAHPVGPLQVLNGCTLRQKFWIAQNLKLHSWIGAVPTQHLRVHSHSVSTVLSPGDQLGGNKQQLQSAVLSWAKSCTSQGRRGPDLLDRLRGFDGNC